METSPILTAYTGSEAHPPRSFPVPPAGSPVATAVAASSAPETAGPVFALLHDGEEGEAVPAPDPSQQVAAMPSEAVDLLSPADPPSRRPRVLLAATGSVASVKLAQLAANLLAFAEVKVMVTRSAKPFLTELQLPDACLPVLDDVGEWRDWHAVGDPVLHIELRRWADVLVIAPLSANTLAKLAAGMCDNLVTCVVRAWDFAKPVLIAPAMNTLMWDSPFTARHLEACRSMGMSIIGPITKRLACGDNGAGAMSEPADISVEVQRILGL